MTLYHVILVWCFHLLQHIWLALQRENHKKQICSLKQPIRCRSLLLDHAGLASVVKNAACINDGPRLRAQQSAAECHNINLNITDSLTCNMQAINKVKGASHQHINKRRALEWAQE